MFRPLQAVVLDEGATVEVHLPLKEPKGKIRAIGDSRLAGMWADRQDVTDSVEYIDRLRRELRG